MNIHSLPQIDDKEMIKHTQISRGEEKSYFSKYTFSKDEPQKHDKKYINVSCQNINEECKFSQELIKNFIRIDFDLKTTEPDIFKLKARQISKKLIEKKLKERSKNIALREETNLID